MKITDITEDKIFKTFGHTYELVPSTVHRPKGVDAKDQSKFDFSTIKNW